MIRDVNLSQYFPDFLKKYREIDATLNAENTELKMIWKCSEDVINNRFISSADEDGIKQFENMLNIQSVASDSLEERRFRILSKWNTDTPLTFRKLQYRLALLCGEDGYSLYHDSTQVIVKITLTNKKMFNDVKKLLDEFIPVALLIKLELLYNQHLTLKNLKYIDLGNYTHFQIRNEVIDETDS